MTSIRSIFVYLVFYEENHFILKDMKYFTIVSCYIICEKANGSSLIKMDEMVLRISNDFPRECFLTN